MSKDKHPRTAIVVGAGPAGISAAWHLAETGWLVTLVERRDGAGAAAPGQNINFTLNQRARRALAGLGIEGFLAANAVPLGGREEHGQCISRCRYGNGSADESLYSVRRGALCSFLLGRVASDHRVDLRMGVDVTGIDLDRGRVEVRGRAGGEVVSADLLVFADGARSLARREMSARSGFDVSQVWSPYIFHELRVRPGHDLSMRHLHVWGGVGEVAVGLPERDGSLSVTWFTPRSTAAIPPARVLSHLHAVLPGLAPLVDDPVETWALGHGKMVQVRCPRWRAGNRGILVGDAAHAMLPFLGMGCNVAVEDGQILAQALRENPDVAAALGEFEVARAPAVARLALEAERHQARLAHPGGGWRDAFHERLDTLLARWLPGHRTSYAQVAFSDERYDRVFRRLGRRRVWIETVTFMMLFVIVAALASCVL